VFDVADPPYVTAVVRNVAGRDQAVTVEYEVSDFNGARLAGGKASDVVPQGQTRSISVRLGDPSQFPVGEYLSVRARLVADGRLQAECHKGFGLLPKAPSQSGAPGQTPFGLLAENQWPLLARLGVRYVRPNWSWAERPMEWASRYGITYCPLMNEANAFVRGEITEQEYADLVRQSIRRYKHYVRYWQLGNEFDIFHRDGPKAYVEAQRVGYAAAKAEDPNCVILGGSITELHVRREGFREALDLGLAKYCDIYDFHFYCDLATTQNSLDYIHATCKALRAEKPIWVTETTQVGMFDPDDRNQADYVFKRYAHLLANGVSVVFWHALSWPYRYSADKTQATALVDYDGFARPSLFAYAALVRTLSETKSVRRWEAGGGVYVLEFARGHRTLLAVWSESGHRSFDVRHAPGESFIAYPSGKRAAISFKDGVVGVRAQKMPAIYDLPGPLAR
jgi:hypothetical protein